MILTSFVMLVFKSQYEGIVSVQWQRAVKIYGFSFRNSSFWIALRVRFIVTCEQQEFDCQYFSLLKCTVKAYVIDLQIVF